MSDPCTYVIFGATGNLSRLKLMPSLYHLEAAGLLSDSTRICAVGRRDWDRERCIAEIRTWVEAKARCQFDEETFGRLATKLD